MNMAIMRSFLSISEPFGEQGANLLEFLLTEDVDLGNFLSEDPTNQVERQARVLRKRPPARIRFQVIRTGRSEPRSVC